MLEAVNVPPATPAFNVERTLALAGAPFFFFFFFPSQLLLAAVSRGRPPFFFPVCPRSAPCLPRLLDGTGEPGAGMTPTWTSSCGARGSP